MNEHGSHDPASGEDHESELTDGGLLSELDLIADQPLEERAASYSRIHDRLQAELNGQ